jgi:hypothetical protein
MSCKPHTPWPWVNIDPNENYICIVAGSYLQLINNRIIDLTIMQGQPRPYDIQWLAGKDEKRGGGGCQSREYSVVGNGHRADGSSRHCLRPPGPNSVSHALVSRPLYPPIEKNSFVVDTIINF